MPTFPMAEKNRRRSSSVVLLLSPPTKILFSLFPASLWNAWSYINISIKIIGGSIQLVSRTHIFLYFQSLIFSFFFCHCLNCSPQARINSLLNKSSSFVFYDDFSIYSKLLFYHRNYFVSLRNFGVAHKENFLYWYLLVHNRHTLVLSFETYTLPTRTLCGNHLLLTWSSWHSTLGINLKVAQESQFNNALKTLEWEGKGYGNWSG